MKEKYLKLTADDLVHLFTARMSTISGPFSYVHKSILRDLAVEMVMRFGASTEVHDELIKLLLQEDHTSGIHQAVLLAPHASPEMQNKVMEAFFLPFMDKNVDRAIVYAKEILGRDLASDECSKMMSWFNCCQNASDKEGRRKITRYIAEKFPEKLEEAQQYFKINDRFWEGPAGLL